MPKYGHAKFNTIVVVSTHKYTTDIHIYWNIHASHMYYLGDIPNKYLNKYEQYIEVGGLVRLSGRVGRKSFWV